MFSLSIAAKAFVRFCHRRSHRHPVPPSGLPGRVRQVRRPSLLSQAGHRWAAPRSRFPFMVASLWRVHHGTGPKTLSNNASSACDRVGPIHERRPLRPVIDPLASNRSHLHVGLWKRMDSFFHAFLAWKSSVISGFWAIYPAGSPCRSDDLKLRRITRFVQRARAEFSTFPGFPCGAGWITQPSIAKMECQHG